MKIPHPCVLLSVTAFCLTTCDSRHTFDNWHDRDYFLHGDEFSVTIFRDSGIQASGWMEHGSGYTAKSQSDYWRVTWKIANLTHDRENPPLQEAYLGKYEAKRERGRNDPVFESGLDMEMSTFTGSGHLLIWKNGQYLAPKVPVVDKVMFEGERNNDGKQPKTLTASRQHMLIWEHPLVICKTSDLAVYREIRESDSVATFRKHHDSAVGIHHVGLTDDLRYIFVVPHNGNDAPQGHNHHRVWGYDVLEDRFFEKSFSNGPGDTAVASVQSWKGQPHYFVYSTDRRELGIFDNEQNLVARIPPDRTRFHNFEANLFWQPDHQTVWIAEGEIKLDQRERRIELRRYNYDTNTSSDFVLKVGRLRSP